MKQLLLTALLLIAINVVFAQITFKVREPQPSKEFITLKNDTLFVPAGTCKYIKVGDKIYKVTVSIQEEVPEPPFKPWSGSLTLPNYITPAINILTENHDGIRL